MHDEAVGLVRLGGVAHVVRLLVTVVGALRQPRERIALEAKVRPAAHMCGEARR